MKDSLWFVYLLLFVVEALKLWIVRCWPSVKIADGWLKWKCRKKRKNSKRSVLSVRLKMVKRME